RACGLTDARRRARTPPVDPAVSTVAVRIRIAAVSRVLIVTGGSRGIGAATARLGAERGYAVCVNYRRNRPAADAVVAAIRSAGGTAAAMQADVSIAADVLELFARVDAELGRVDALVNNAGIL